MFTDEQLVGAFRDSVHYEEGEYGSIYHQRFQPLPTEIDEYGIAVLGDSFYGVPIDMARLRKNLAAIGLGADTVTSKPINRLGRNT